VITTNDESGLPWVQLRKIFKHRCQDGKETSLVVAQRFLWCVPKSPLDARVEAPHVKLADFDNCNKPFILIHPNEITHLVQLIQDKTAETREFTEGEYDCFWVNWWLSIGPHKYPLEHFDDMKKTIK
jgi:hypothetical protein